MLTFLLAKVFGIYSIIIGVALLTRGRYLRHVFNDFATDKLMRFVISTVEFVAGLFLIFTHEIWEPTYAAIVSLFGWLLMFEGLIYLFLPERYLARWVKLFNRPSVWVIGGLISIAIGAYLTYAGFYWVG